ncbi:unnamed protein product [Cuscuta campestris]|uniref:Uncharacterized protein n=1 Tax=Cuscuta campestris TaxID=132261 RepID=A0A484KMD1_9ASTE|nr:unnamed protein product [Cuscuta campestris]
MGMSTKLEFLETFVSDMKMNRLMTHAQDITQSISEAVVFNEAGKSLFAAFVAAIFVQISELGKAIVESCVDSNATTPSSDCPLLPPLGNFKAVVEHGKGTFGTPRWLLFSLSQTIILFRCHPSPSLVGGLGVLPNCFPQARWRLGMLKIQQRVQSLCHSSWSWYQNHGGPCLRGIVNAFRCHT